MHYKPRIYKYGNTNILPDGTRVFLKDSSLFGDIKTRVCRVEGWNINVQAQEYPNDEPCLEYFLILPDGREIWVNAQQIDGYLLGM